MNQASIKQFKHEWDTDETRRMAAVIWRDQRTFTSLHTGISEGRSLAEQAGVLFDLMTDWIPLELLEAYAANQHLIDVRRVNWRALVRAMLAEIPSSRPAANR